MYFEYYRDIKGEYRWRLKSDNHEIIAHGEGYTTKQSCLYAISLVQRTTIGTKINEL